MLSSPSQSYAGCRAPVVTQPGPAGIMMALPPWHRDSPSRRRLPRSESRPPLRLPLSASTATAFFRSHFSNQIPCFHPHNEIIASVVVARSPTPRHDPPRPRVRAGSVFQSLKKKRSTISGSLRTMEEIEYEAPAGSKTACRIREPTAKDRARQIMMGLTTVLAVVAVCMVLAGVSILYMFSHLRFEKSVKRCPLAKHSSS